MLILNFFNTFYHELIGFFVDIKNIIINITSSIYNFLNKYMSKEAIGIFLIAAIALLVIFIFRKVSDK